MPSIPLVVDSSLENSTCNIDDHRRGRSGDSSHLVNVNVASAVSRPCDDQQQHHQEHHQHNNISDLSDDNNGSDEEQRREAAEVITPMRSPPSVKAAVATALEAEQLMEQRRTAEATTRQPIMSTEGVIECKESNVDSHSDKPRTPLPSRSRSRSARKSVSPAAQKVGTGITREYEYVGVTYSRARNQWQARVCILQKQQYCGRYRLAADAARAYDDTIKKLGLQREANFSSEEEYLRARREEVVRHEEAAQRQRDVMAAARAAAGLGSALTSYASAPASVSAANIDHSTTARSGSSAIASHVTSGTKRELEVDFTEAKTPPPPVAKKTRNDLKAQTQNIKGSNMDSTALAAITGPIDSVELDHIVRATEQRMKSK